MNQAKLNRLKLDIVLERMRRKRRNRLLLIISSILEICACALAWYFYEWRIALILFILLWAVNIKARKEATDA